MVVIDTDAARATLDMLDPATDGDVDEAVDAMAFQQDFYGTHLDDVNRETFRRLLIDPEAVSDHFALEALAEGFREAGDRIAELRERVSSLESIETTTIEADVRRYLPDQPELDTTVHGVLDGFNGGFQHDGDVAISILQNQPEDFGPKLRHELHHVGAVEVRGDDPFARLTTPATPERDATDLVSILLLEGVAIANAQGGLSVYEREPDLASTIADYREREAELFASVEETLRRVATTGNAEQRQSLVDAVVTDPDGALPPTHYVGARMIETIDAVQGRGTAVEHITSMEGFLQRYQVAANDRDQFTFSKPTVQEVSNAVSQVKL